MGSMDRQALENKLKREARYLHISIPYDEDEGCEMITFDDGFNIELQIEDGYVPPMFNNESRTLEVTVDLYERKAIGWDDDKGYIHMWGKVIDSGSYTLLDASMKPLSQIQGYVPSALVPPYERGFGDYLELTINPDGSLLQWRNELDFSDFIEKGREPQSVQNVNRKAARDEKLMKEYIIYTTEGHTIAPNENVEVENCQVLGRVYGKDEKEAQANLLEENPWILKAGFSPSRFIVKQLAKELKTYQVEIIETNSRVISVEAESPQEAREKIRKDYMDGLIVLDEENSYVDVSFNLV